MIFKAPSSVENASALYKTFNSYNHNSTYRPSLKIVYASLSSTTTVNSLEYSNTKSMAAGNKYAYKYTPTEKTKYSAWTTGSIDTKLYVYKNSAMTSLVGSDDNSGHGYNPCITLELEAGTTYYFVVQGANALTAGTFTFKFQRDLPRSSSEKASSFSTFNNPGYKDYTNCYVYALNMYVNPKTGQRFRMNGQNPGEMAGQAITLSDLSNATTAKSKIEAKDVYFVG